MIMRSNSLKINYAEINNRNYILKRIKEIEVEIIKKITYYKKLK